MFIQAANPLLLGRYRASADEQRFLTRGGILYTTCDEDSWSEINGLALAPDDVVMSITGSGCRTLNLLIGGPKEIVSVDANPLQNYLLELKIAGIREYDYAGFAKFIGLHRSDDRVASYQRLRPLLTEPARVFWDRNTNVIARGVLYSGAHENFYARYIGPMVRLLRPRKTRQLFSQRSIDEQLRFFDRKWDTPSWRLCLALLAQPHLVKLLLHDPSYYLFVERRDSLAKYINGRLRQVLTQHLSADNHLLALLVFGRYLNDHAVPPYLSPEHYDFVRSRLDVIKIVTQPVRSFLEETPPDKYSKYSLSDIAGWTSPTEFDDILHQVARTARPGARFCYRNFLSDREVPASLDGRVTVREDLADRLTTSDCAFVFTFVVGDVERPSGQGGKDAR
jgi:S-adenosylmethionine-diacylglycerol 3-amino-3-carboxypropyl transferase